MGLQSRWSFGEVAARCSNMLESYECGCVGFDRQTAWQAQNVFAPLSDSCLECAMAWARLKLFC